jgi:predicted Zn-dependent protease
VSAILDQIQGQLEAHPRVQDWIVRETRQDSNQLYLIGAEPEAERLTHTTRYDIDIYHDHDGGRGEASVSLQPGEVGQLGARLDEATYLAGLSHNPPFSLPRAAAYPQVEAWDPAIGTPDAAARAARDLAEQARAAVGAEAGVRLSSMEIYLNAAEVTLRTSAGVSATRRGTAAECELVVTSRNDAGEESEAQDLWARRRVTDLDVAGRARRQAQYARDSLRARPPGGGEWPVVLEAETMLPFFAPVTYRSAASSKYRQATPWEPGRPIAPDSATVGPDGAPFDPFNLASDGLLPFGAETRAFDDEGLPARQFDLIAGGALVGYWATQRYADYLGIAATGRLSNFAVGPGPRGAADLLSPAGDTPLLHVVTFSWLNPDSITGAFVGEIRLGYEVSREGVQPVKGGAVSGNVFRALTQAHFSSETAFAGSYLGPAWGRFHGLTVSS